MSCPVYLLCILSIYAFFLPKIDTEEDSHYSQLSPPKPAFRIAVNSRNWNRRRSRGYVWEHSGRFEGDIAGANANRGFPNNNKKSVRRWRDNVVPYYIVQKHFTKREVRVILSAMDSIAEYTCVTFRPYDETDSDFIRIVGRTGVGCSSFIGRQRRGQDVFLESARCTSVGIVLHELMHVLGFDHQHSAYNRDKYIEIIWENIEQGEEDNFEINVDNVNIDYLVGYDYYSVLHYSAYAFSRNGKPTIKPRNKNVTLTKATFLSEKDIQRLKYLYNC